jgi:hypothetical protein
MTRRGALATLGAGSAFAVTGGFASHFDAVSPAAASSGSAVNWSSGRFLPEFDEAAEPVDAIDPNDLPTRRDALLMHTLKGAINKNGVRIHIPFNWGSNLRWVDDLNVSFDWYTDHWNLVDKYASEIGEFVVYDPNVPHTVNVANTIASVEDICVVHPDLKSTIESYGYTMAHDLRGQFADYQAAYDWAITNYWDKCERRIIGAVQPSWNKNDDGSFQGDEPYPGGRDYVVATDAFCMWLDVNKTWDKNTMDTLFGDMQSGGIVWGWTADEVTGVEHMSKNEVTLVPSMVGASSLSGLNKSNALNAIETNKPEPESVPELEDKVYVTMTFSEGDNLDYCQNTMKRDWENADRGSFPMNWSISPLLYDVAPEYLRYIYETNTNNEHFMCGPSGVTYFYPKDYPDSAEDSLLSDMAPYFDQTGLETIYMLNRVGIDSDLSYDTANKYDEHLDPKGIALGWDANPEGKPYTEIKGTDLMVANGIIGLREKDPTADEIAQHIRDRTPDNWSDDPRPVFLSGGVFGFNVDPTEVRNALEQLDSETYRFVRGDQFFELARQSDKGPYNGPHTAPGRVEAEDFDTGGEGAGYYDASKYNAGASYRDLHADIESSSEGGYDIGWNEPGEWWEYTVEADAAGEFHLDVRVASDLDGGAFRVEVNGEEQASTSFSGTGGWQSWTTEYVGVVELDAGTNEVRVVAEDGGFNWNWIEFNWAQNAYNGPHTLPGRVEAEDFDAGGESVAYHDTTDGNNGGAYRSTDVDIESCSEGGYNIGWVASGEWWEYSVSADAAGTYDVDVRVASDVGGGTVSIDVNGTQQASKSVSGTGGWQSWSTATIGSVELTEGYNRIRVTADDGGVNFNWVEFTTTNVAYNGPHAIPGRVDAEDFDTGGEGVAYHDTTSGNDGGAYRSTDVDIGAANESGYCINWIETGEWWEYTVSVDDAGTYELYARVSSDDGGGALHVDVDGSQVASESFGTTGGWQTWETLSLGTVNLSAGDHTIRVTADADLWNFNWFERW